MSTREQFEKWYAENKDGDWLWRVNKVDAFHIWEASRAVAFEEAACEMDAMQEHDSTNYYRHAAMCIRALAEPEGE